MKDTRYIHTWEKTRRIGAVLYILIWAFLLPIACVIGKVIGDYISTGIIFKPFRIPDYIAMISLCFIFFMIGVYVWNKKEERYKQLIKNVDNMSKDYHH